MEDKIPQEIKDGFQKMATDYSNSEATTNAGRVLRFLAKIIPVDVVIKILSHQLSK